MRQQPLNARPAHDGGARSADAGGRRYRPDLLLLVETSIGSAPRACTNTVDLVPVSRPPAPGPVAPGLLTVVPNGDEESGVLVLRVAGEIDLVTVGEFRDHLGDHLSRAVGGMVLECSAVSFLAGCGLRALAETVEQARAGGVSVCVVTGGARPVRRAIEAGGLAGTVPQAVTVEAAATYCAA